MTAFQVVTTNNDSGDNWDGDRWESEIFTSPSRALREYFNIVTNNLMGTMSDMHSGDELRRHMLLCEAEIDRMHVIGADLCRLTPVGQNVTEINDGFYRVELRCVQG